MAISGMTPAPALLYVKQAGCTADWCVIVSGDQRNYHRRIFVWRGTPSLAVDLNANSHKIINLAAPTLSGDAANKGYVDGAISTATATLAPQSRTISNNNPADRRRRFVLPTERGAFSYTGTLPFPAALALASAVGRAASAECTLQRQRTQRRWILGAKWGHIGGGDPCSSTTCTLQRHDQLSGVRVTQTRDGFCR